MGFVFLKHLHATYCETVKEERADFRNAKLECTAIFVTYSLSAEIVGTSALLAVLWLVDGILTSMRKVH